MAANAKRQLESLMRELERGWRPNATRRRATAKATRLAAARAPRERTRAKTGKAPAKDYYPPSSVVLSLSNVRKEYEMGEARVAALDGVNLTVKRGESLAIMGPSGSGKSTLLHILGLLDRPTSGRMRLDGTDVQALDDASLARVRGEKIGFVFQSFFLVPTLTAWENVALPMMFAGVPQGEREARAKRLLHKVGLADRAGHLPSELSGGQRQRVAIARSLANNPAILLADEPTGNLDSKSGKDIMDVFAHLHQNEGRTLILVTHDPNMQAHVQRVVTLRDGRVERDSARR